MPLSNGEGSSNQQPNYTEKQQETPAKPTKAKSKKAPVSQDVGRNAEKALNQGDAKAQPGELVKAVDDALIPHDVHESPDEEGNVAFDDDSDDVEDLLNRVEQERPRLVERLETFSTDQEVAEALQRLFVDDQILHPDEYADSEFTVNSYGDYAPSIINGINAITHSFAGEAQDERLAHPRLLMLGAQSPIAASDVISLTQPFNPESVTLTDISQVGLDLAKTQEPTLQTVQADWYDKKSTTTLPEFDIALGNRIVDMLAQPGDHSPFLSARRNALELAQILSNIAPRMSEKGGMVLLLNMPAVAETTEYKRQIYLIQSALLKRGLLVTGINQAIEFQERPSHQDMAKKETYITTDEQGNLQNMVRYIHGIMIVVQRLTQENVAKLQTTSQEE